MLSRAGTDILPTGIIEGDTLVSCFRGPVTGADIDTNPACSARN